MKFLRAGLVLVGAVIGAVCGWLMARETHSYFSIALGAVAGGFVGSYISGMIEDD